MKNLNRKILLAVGAIVFSATAHAEIFLNPAIYMESTTQESSGITTESSSQIIIPTVAYLMSNGVYLGATYITNKNQDGYGFTAFGPTVGIFKNGFLGAFSYHLSAEYKSSATTTMTGKAMEVDVGYLAQVTNNFHIGPQIKYLSFTFDESESSGTTTSIDYKISTYQPYIGLLFIF